jgi:hypothetical protein
MTTPFVQYGYANGSSNTVRLTDVSYPDGREISLDYGSTGSMPDALSRVASIVDQDNTHLADYSYLGERSIVVADSPQPQVKSTFASLTGTNDPDTGDIYTGLDRFGRVKDNRWYDYGAAADADRIKFGYDRAGNRTWRQNTVADAQGKHFDELYGNDLIHRLKELARGTLNANKNGVNDKSFAECWSLDPTGNWKKFLEDTNGDGTWNLDQARTSNTVNEITGITESAGPSWATPAYSAAGNMTTIPQPSDPTKTYTATYDAWNRLVKVVDDDTDDTVAEYQYDGANRRIVQKSYDEGDLQETRHLYYTQPSQWQVVEERIDAETDPDRQFVWGLRYIDDLVLRDRDTNGDGSFNERLYALQDANWNLTGPDRRRGGCAGEVRVLGLRHAAVPDPVIRRPRLLIVRLGDPLRRLSLGDTHRTVPCQASRAQLRARDVVPTGSGRNGGGPEPSTLLPRSTTHYGRSRGIERRSDCVTSRGSDSASSW